VDSQNFTKIKKFWRLSVTNKQTSKVYTLKHRLGRQKNLTFEELESCLEFELQAKKALFPYHVNFRSKQQTFGVSQDKIQLF